MNKILKLFTWILESNRPVHVAAGLIILAFCLTVCMFLNIDLWKSAVIAVMGSLIGGVSADVKDLQHGGKFDCLDVLATILPSIIFLILVLIFR